MTPPGESSTERQELGHDYIQTFDELRVLGAVGFEGGKTVTFQPWGRYEEQRQTGTVRLWEENSDAISIEFMGSKVGVRYPDSERITRAQFAERKDTWKIRMV